MAEPTRWLGDGKLLHFEQKYCISCYYEVRLLPLYDYCLIYECQQFRVATRIYSLAFPRDQGSGLGERSD